MASLTNQKIKDTYKGLLKTSDNEAIDGAVEITDGDGNSTGVTLSNDGQVTATGTITGGTLTDGTATLTGGTLTGGVTGNVTGDLTGDVTGDVTGSVTGNLTGDVTGNVTGDVTGDLTGNVTGNVTGDLTGNVTGNTTGTVTATSVLADGVAATTQLLNDNSTKVATTAYVDAQVTAEDLDFSGNSGSGQVDLDSESLEITGSNGITTTALNNTLDIDGSTLETSINTNASDISTNASNISTNAANITSNDSDISSLQTDVSTNTSNINTNASNISNNDTDIATNVSNIATNTSGIATNVTNIATNASNISSNDTDISNLQGDVSTNTGNISTNATNISSNDTDISNLQSDKQNTSEKNQANGYAPLDSGAKIPIANLPDSVVGQVEYQGTWNASTNIPSLPSASTSKGHYYVVATAGTYQTISYAIGDWVISNGTAWEKVDNTDAVTTVFGRLGAIVANESDYSGFYPLLSDLSTTNSNVSNNASNITTNATDITTNASNIATNTSNISSNDTDIATNASNISTNTSNISSNDTDIATNTSNIATNTSGVATNVTNISTNATNISSNDTDIATNASGISTNASGISTNVTNIATNTSDISTNAGNISTNTTNISSNDTDIATNASNISTNTSNISTNTTDIAGKVSKSGDTMTGDLTISKSNALLTVFDSDTSGSVPAIRLQARTVMNSNIPIYLTSDENQDFAIRESSINSTNYADTTVGNLSVVRNDAGEAQLSVFSNNNTQTTSRVVFKVKNPMSGTPFSGNLIFSNDGYTFEKTGSTILELGSSYHYTPKPIRIGANSSANELDDFEEGDANLSFGVSYAQPGSGIAFYSGTDFSSWSDNSKYVKVGSSVTVYIDITFSNSSASPTNWLSSTYSIFLGGLPFGVAGSYISDYSKTSPLHGDYSFGKNMMSYSNDVGFQIRPYKWGTYGMYFGFSSHNAYQTTTPLRGDDFNYTIGYSNYGVRQITGVIHYRTTQ